MTDTQNTPNGSPAGASPTPPVPLGYWLRAVDALIAREFATALAAEDVDRRDWMLLNAVSGDVDVPAWLASRMHGRGGKRLRALTERGWVARTDDAWTLTEEGRAAKSRLAGIVEGIRERVSGAVSPEDYATMTASLESIARELGGDELGGDESGRMPRFGRRRDPGFGFGFGPGRGFEHGFGTGFRPGSGPAFGPGFGSRGDRHGAEGGAAEHCGRRKHGRHDRGHDHAHAHRGERPAEHAFERGFDAGFRAAKERAEAS